MSAKSRSCHVCKFKYSCGYTGCLSGLYSCCELHLFKRANKKFWSLILQKETTEAIAREHFVEHGGSEVVEDKEAFP